MSSDKRADKNKQTDMGVTFSSKPETTGQTSGAANLVDADSTSPRSVLQLEPVKNLLNAVDKLSDLLDHAKSDIKSLLETEQGNQQLLKTVDELHKTLESTKQETMANVQSLNALLEHHRNSEAGYKEKYETAYQLLSKYKEGCRQLNENLKLAKGDVDRLSGDKVNLRERIDALNTENNTIKQELSECKSRLSKLLSDRLTDNNPQIADLSDSNRPTKLAEKHSELYDNQWTDAFEELQKKFDDTDSVQILLKCLMRVHRFCTEQASEQVRQLKQVAYMQQTEEMQRSDAAELKAMIKVIRKHTTEINVHNVCKAFASKYPIYTEDPKILKYVEECVRLCWLMNAQDPSVVFGETPQENAEFNVDLYKPFTQKGVTMQYLVWPVLLLNEGGALLAKGIAQGCKAVKKPELGTRAGTESRPNQGEPNVSTNHDDSATTSSGFAGNDTPSFQDAHVKRNAVVGHTDSQAVKGDSNKGSARTVINIPSSAKHSVLTTQSVDSGSVVPTYRQPESPGSQNIGPTYNSNLSESRRVAASHPANGTTSQQQNMNATTHGRTVINENGPPPEMGLYYEYYRLGKIECAKRLGIDVFLKCDAYHKSGFGSKD
ncbi:uncharacterized protein LOC127849026 [Dreissena polymorpha]|uniref:Mitochondria-eating protein n=1 Tax=Dreissena polymorpha TaxID=45954 RepID=A0A9D4DL97_DREPO|nr:uncharacterized protein LOC127849026 [Dreissena polymorpha]KAH3749674.1 hypothetical protein DPMN_184180 [Dreissena polymorpha]